MSVFYLNEMELNDYKNCIFRQKNKCNNADRKASCPFKKDKKCNIEKIIEDLENEQK